MFAKPKTSKKKKIITGGMVSSVVVGLIIFLVLFFGPFSKYVDSDDFWKKAEEIVKEERSFNKQWYVRFERQQETDKWLVKLYGSKNEELATKGTIEKTMTESKMFLWSEMTKAQTDEYSANLEVSNIDMEDESNGHDVLFVVLLARLLTPVLKDVEPETFWKTVAEIRGKESSCKQWYTTAQRIEGNEKPPIFEFVLHGSIDVNKANEGNIEMTIKKAMKFVQSKMTYREFYVDSCYAPTSITTLALKDDEFGWVSFISPLEFL